MSNYDDDFDFEDDPQESNAMREVRKAQRAAEKRAKELEAELLKFRENERQRNLSSLLESRGLNPKVAKFIPDDAVDENAISSWLDEYGDVFGAGAPAVRETNVQPENAAELAEFASFNSVVDSGAPPVGDEAQMLALIQGADTPEELNKILFGSPFGPAAQ